MYQGLVISQIHQIGRASGRASEVQHETPIRRILRLLEQEQKLKHTALARAVCAEKAGDLP